MDKERKVYTSFHDIPPRDYMYFPKGTIEVGKPGKFSMIEIKHILVSVFVLTIAFSFWNRGLIFKSDLNIIVSSIPFAFAGVVTGFFSMRSLINSWPRNLVYGLNTEFIQWVCY